MRLRSVIGAQDSQTPTIGRGTHARRHAVCLRKGTWSTAFVGWVERLRDTQHPRAQSSWLLGLAKGSTQPTSCAATGGGGSALKACPAEIGFVPPKSTQPRGGGDRGPRVASFAEIGFVPPKAPQPRGGGDRGPGVAAWPRRGRTAQRIERPDCGFPPRQRTPLVALQPHQPGGDVAGGGESFHHDLRAHA